MDSNQKKISCGIIASVLVVWLISSFLIAGRESPVPPMQGLPQFDGSQAYANTQDFVRRFPSRVFGSLESRPATGYLHDRLAELGYTVTYTHFDGRIARRKRVGRNVLGFRQGQSPEILAAVAHLDTAPTAMHGAMDNGSGVGVLLEIARVLAAGTTRRSLLLIFSDGGEWGSLGAKDLAESFPHRNRIAAVLSLDHVSSGDLAAFCLEETGQFRGFTPPWLRELALQAAGSEGLPVEAPSTIAEHFERVFLISGSDQGPFLGAGIPAVNLGSRSVDKSLEKAVYHSPQDTIANLTPSSFKKFGSAAERILRTLDSMPSMPRKSPDSFRLWNGHYWGTATVAVLHAVTFLPLLAILVFYAKNHRGRLNTVSIRRELLVCFGTFLPFWAFYLCISLTRALRLLPIYSLYPATAKDPVLMNPPWNIPGSIACASLLVAVVSFIFGKYAVRSLPKPDFHSSKLVLLGLTMITAGLALTYNSYWATAFLLLPAWIWALVEKGVDLGAKLKNGVLILASGIPCSAALWAYFSRLDLGWVSIWYQILALSSGMFTATGFYLGVAGLVLGIRFLVIQFRESL